MSDKTTVRTRRRTALCFFLCLYAALHLLFQQHMPAKSDKMKKVIFIYNIWLGRTDGDRDGWVVVGTGTPIPLRLLGPLFPFPFSVSSSPSPPPPPSQAATEAPPALPHPHPHLPHLPHSPHPTSPFPLPSLPYPPILVHFSLFFMLLY